MNRLSIILALAVVLVATGGCSSTQQAALQAPAVYRTVVDPAVPIQDKACTVLDWGLPVARERTVTLTGRQLALANAATEAAVAYCIGKDLSWQMRAVAAADSLSKVLWDIVK